MNRYIKLEDAISICGPKLILADGAAIGQRHPTPDENITALLDLSTTDIIHCGECELEWTQKCPPHRMGLIHEENDYCSYGIRKEANND